MKRGFKGVWIPRDIWLATGLTMTEKVFLIEVDSLDCGEGCYASDDHFAEFLGIAPKTVQNIISALKKEGLLRSEGFGKNRRLYAQLSLGRESEGQLSLERETSTPNFPENGKELSRNRETPIYRIKNTIKNTVVAAATTPPAGKEEGETGYDVYRRYCRQVPINLFNQERLTAMTEDLDLFAEVMEIWVGRQYQEQNVTGILNLFSRMLGERQAEARATEVVVCDKCIDGWIEVDGGFKRCSH